MLTLWLPPVFLAILAFSTLFISPAAGERLGYGVTVYLASQFAKGIQQLLMPICKEVVWIDIYIFFHEIFYFSILMTSCTSVYFYYCTREHFLPLWLSIAQRQPPEGYEPSRPRQRKGERDRQSRVPSTGASSTCTGFMRWALELQRGQLLEAHHRGGAGKGALRPRGGGWRRAGKGGGGGGRG